MVKKDASDEALLEAVAAGDRDAFTTLAHRHHGGLRRYVSSRLAEGVDDVMQEVLVAIFRSAPTYEGQSTPRAWFYGIARNCVHRHTRRRVGEPAHFETLELGVLAMRAGWGEPPRAESALELARVREAIDRLPEQAREVLIMRDVEGMTNPEVADVLGLEIPAVKSRIHRARLALMGELQEAT